MTPQRTMFIGDMDHEDFVGPREYLRSQCAEFQELPSLEDAYFDLRQGMSAPQLIVIAQLWPGQFAQSRIEALHRLAPLARLVALLGSWCEGEACSGSPWTGVPRVYWHEFRLRLQSEHDTQSGWGRASRLPRTATEAERFDVACRPRVVRDRGLIVVSAADRLTFEGLAEGCVQAGYDAVWLASASQEVHAVAGIWDDSSNAAARPLSMARFAARISPAPVVAMLNFPRQEDVRSAMASGALFVQAKPFCWDDLLGELRRFTGKAALAESAA